MKGARSTPNAAARGFGPAKPPPPPPRPPSAASAKRTKAAEAFDELTSSGAPEYEVAVRTVTTDGTCSAWMSVGGLAVPRSSSEDMAVSMAIFGNEDDLLKGAFRNYPKLKVSEDKFEYGYKLKEFPEDEYKIASKEATEQSDNAFLNWFNALDSPLNKD